MTESKKLPRYSRVEDILRLAILMQSRLQGISLADIQEEFEVSRRTAERMRDALADIFPVEEVYTPERTKRWRFSGYNINSLIQFTAEELAELEGLKAQLKYNESKEMILGDIINKIKALGQKQMLKIETDLEALLEAEGCAVSQYRRFKMPKELVLTIREALKSFKKLQFEYNDKIRKVHPYGILNKQKSYLVCFDEEQQKILNYLIPKIAKIKVVDEYFSMDDNFSLKDYSEKSFGIFQEEPMEIVLKFSGIAVDDAKDYFFHPTQFIQEQEDGSVLVSFKAGGKNEILWELFKWGECVEIIQPKELKEVYLERVQQVLSVLQKPIT